MGTSRTGAGGADMIIKVPVGTQILEEDRETMLADLSSPGDQIVLAYGGGGGRGNESFKSSTNRSPRQFEPGGEVVELTLWLRLKLIADAGLIGLPNAGKSTFLTAVSRARPKIGDYPFTTLYPNLGVAQAGAREVILADIPGLIEGAHEGVGLGDRFLGHVERCRALIHLVDGTADDVAADYRTVRGELQAYDEGLPDKLELVCLNKCDALTDDAIAERRAELADAAGADVYVISGIAGKGLPELLNALVTAMDAPTEGLSIDEAEGWRP
jgi:GTP-binding protein